MIELELRGECTQQYDGLKQRLAEASTTPPKEKRRVSVMCFGTMGEKNIDIRCRITNGNAEVVGKMGDFHAHNRTEVSQEVSLEQMIGLAKLFAAMDFKRVKVGTRIQVQYTIDDVVVDVARSNSGLAYIELERMVAHEDDVQKEKSALEELAKKLGVTLWEDGEAFQTFCARLTNEDDWIFTGSDEDCTRLLAEITTAEADR